MEILSALGLGIVAVGIAFAVSVFYATFNRDKYLQLQIEFEEAQTAKLQAQIEYQQMVNKSAILDGLKSTQEELELETIEYQIEQ